MLDAKYGGKAPAEAVARLGIRTRDHFEKRIRPVLSWSLPITPTGRAARGSSPPPAAAPPARWFLMSIGISEVNPLFFKLPFERFLNPFRVRRRRISTWTSPTIAAKRSWNTCKGKYGADKVAQICTFGTMQARAAVRDVTRALGLPYAFGDRMAKLIPPGAQGFAMTIDRAMSENAELRRARCSRSRCQARHRSR